METWEDGWASAGRTRQTARMESAHETRWRRNPLTAVPPKGFQTAYVCTGVAGHLPAAGDAVVVELAPVGRRFTAAVVDLALAACSLAVPAPFACAVQCAVDPGGRICFLLALWLLGFVWLTLYGAAFVVLCGGTPGLLLTGLRVARAWEGHARPGWRQAVRRARFLAVMGWLVPLLNVAVVVARLGGVLRERPYHQSTFDTAAATVVVRRQTRAAVAASRRPHPVLR